MRTWLLSTSLVALLVGLSFSSSAEAQGTTNLYKNNYGKPYNGPARQQSSPLLGGRFRVRDFFPSVFAYDPKPNFTTATIPDPNSKAYLDAFGFRRVGGR